MNYELNSVVIIGLGLIGGSLAKALRKANANIIITAIDINADILNIAHLEKVVDFGFTEIPQSLNSDIIFLCAPVESCKMMASKLVSSISVNTIITDMCSTKSELEEYFTLKENEIGKHIRYIGGHPMAGSEKSGYEASSVYLFENAYYIICPMIDSNEMDVGFIKNIAEMIGAIPFILSAKSHDMALARISHLPHIIASALVNSANIKETEDGVLRLLAAGGFKDITRIASGDPTLWRTICQSNKQNIAESIDDVIGILQKFKNDLLYNADNTEIFFKQAQEYRNSFRDGVTTIMNLLYELNVDVADRPGAIAEISSMLYNAGINIRNIYISGHRDLVGGQLRLVFNSKKDLEKASNLLHEGNINAYQ